MQLEEIQIISGESSREHTVSLLSSKPHMIICAEPFLSFYIPPLLKDQNEYTTPSDMTSIVV
eukprot:757755-Hanusia_phi.AAC.2